MTEHATDETPGRVAQLWLVRHGQTAWNLEGRYQGQADPPLNPTGWEQAKSLVPQLAGVPFQAVYSSDLQRAQTTAQVLAEGLGLPLRREPRLCEINQGAWEGMLVGEIQARYADIWHARKSDVLTVRPPGGESVAEVADRVWGAVDEIVRRHPAGPLLLVSHGLSLATIICRARGLPLESVYDYIPDNCTADVVSWPAPPDR